MLVRVTRSNTKKSINEVTLSNYEFIQILNESKALFRYVLSTSYDSFKMKLMTSEDAIYYITNGWPGNYSYREDDMIYVTTVLGILVSKE